MSLIWLHWGFKGARFGHTERDTNPFRAVAKLARVNHRGHGRWRWRVWVRGSPNVPWQPVGIRVGKMEAMQELIERELWPAAEAAYRLGAT